MDFCWWIKPEKNRLVLTGLDFSCKLWLLYRFTIGFVLDLTWRKTRTVCWKEEYFIKYHLIVALTLRLYQVLNIYCYNATFMLWCPSVSLTIADSNICMKSVAFLYLDRSVRPSGLDLLFTLGMLALSYRLQSSHIDEQP